MFLSELTLQNFGSFESADLHFSGGQLNVIYGANGTGKTQVLGAILAAVVGRRAIKVDRRGVGPAGVRLSVQEGEVKETIALRVTIDARGEPVIEQSTQTQGSSTSLGPLGLRLLTAISDPGGPSLVLRGSTDSTPFTVRETDALRRILPDEMKTDPLWLTLQSGGSLEGRYRSGGTASLGTLLREFAKRKRKQTALPLIVDEFLWKISDEHRQLAAKILASIAATSQVLVLSHTLPDFPAPTVVALDPSRPRAITLAYYNYFDEDQRPYLSRHQPRSWVRDQRFSKQEDRTCELKEVKGANPVSSIKSVVDEYVVAFLNAGSPQEGAIFWGIRDGDLTVVGVVLTDQMCDELRRAVTEKLHQITPPLSPAAYQIHLHAVSDGSKLIDDLYVVEVRVPPTRRMLLFSTGKQEVYVKTDAGRKRLSAVEIQQELLRRLGIDPSF